MSLNVGAAAQATAPSSFTLMTSATLQTAAILALTEMRAQATDTVQDIF